MRGTDVCADVWPVPQRGRVIALVGAESTGKSTLAAALCAELNEATGLRCTWVPEVLRTWCDAMGRTPRASEQAAIAAEQAACIARAATEHDVVVCDTTPLMTAVYHRHVFGLDDLDAPAIRWQRRCDATLLTALDLPWEPDGLQRDGPHVREPVDTTLRQLMLGAGLPFTVVGGQGERRLQAALAALAPLFRRTPSPRQGLLTRLIAREIAAPARSWVCETCDVPDCEHALRAARADGHSTV